MRIDRLSVILASDADPDLTPDEILRYLVDEVRDRLAAETDPHERQELEALLAAHPVAPLLPWEREEIETCLAESPLARHDLDAARHQMELERHPLDFSDPPPRREWQGFRWLAPPALAFATMVLVVVAFLVGRGFAPVPDERPLSVAATHVGSQGPVAPTMRERALDAQLWAMRRERAAKTVPPNASTKVMDVTREKMDRPEGERTARRRGSTPQGFTAGRSALGVYGWQAPTHDVPGGTTRVVSRGSGPLAFQEGSIPLALTIKRVGGLLHPDGAVLVGADGALDSPPTLESPAPEARSSATTLDRLVLALPTTPQDYEWQIWALGEKGQIIRRLPDPQEERQGDRTALRPKAPLGPGRYAVGVRAKTPPSPVASESERPWRVYDFRVLKPDEAHVVDRAPEDARRDPRGAAMELYDLGRLEEARLVLRVAPEKSDTKRLLAALDRRIAQARRGRILSIDPDAPKDDPPTPTVPIDVAIQTVTPLPEDSPEALQRTLDAAIALRADADAPQRRRLFDQAAAMAVRLGTPDPVVGAGMAILDGLIQGSRLAEAEPYVLPTFEAAGRALVPPDAPSDGARDRYMATCYYASEVYNLLGDYERALEFIEKAKVYLPQSKDSVALEHLAMEEAFATQGKGQLPDAERGWRNALEILRNPPKKNSAHPRWIETHAMPWAYQVATAESYLAQCLYQTGEYEEAATLCREALQSLSGGDRVGPLTIKASIEIDRGEDGLVEKDLEAAQDIISHHAVPLDAQAQFQLARATAFVERLKLSDADAGAPLKEAKRLAHDAHRPDIEATADLNLEMLALLRDPRRERPGEVGEAALPVALVIKLDGKATAYASHGKWKDAADAAREARGIVEVNGLTRFRARVSDDLAWAEANLGGAENLEAAGKDFEAARTAFEAGLRGGRPERIGTIQERSVADLYARYAWTLCQAGKVDAAQAVLNGGRALGLRALRGDRPRNESAAIRKAIDARPKTLHLQYATLDARRTLLLVSSKGAPNAAFTLPFGTEQLTRRMGLWQPDARPEDRKVPSAEKDHAAALGSLLLGPIEGAGLWDPERFPHLVVVGDGAIQNVPFAALIDRDGERLTGRFAVRYALALGLEASTPSIASRSLYAAAYPDDGTTPGIVKEVREVVSLFVRPRSTPLLGAQARASAARREMADYRVLLLACHGVRGEGDLLDACLQLAPDGADRGRLTAGQVAGLRLRADLAVLAACGTAVGQSAGGDGLVGMAWAFQAAGCRSVVATGWSVDDEASHVLVVDFFKRLKSGTAEDEALRTAAIDVIRDHPGYRDPYYWAGFRIIGDPSPIRF